MIPDNRIEDVTLIFGPFDAYTCRTEVGEFIGSEGYFTNKITNYGDLSYCKRGVLAAVYELSDCPYKTEVGGRFCFFLPVEYAGEK